ncbi:galactose-binding domain-containing protein, partial [Roseiconus lacunae]
MAAVRIRLTDTDFLNLAEVEILQRSTGINLALTGTATQSSIYNGNTGAEKAIDGDTVSGYPVSLTHTRREFGAWWQLELLQPADVETIRVYNRDGYGTRLEDAVVEALAADGSILWSDVITGADNGSIHSF